MKFRIRNEFTSEQDQIEKTVTPFDYDKFRDGRLVEFNTEKDLYEFLLEARNTINYVDSSTWDWIDIWVGINERTHELEICIWSTSAD